MDCPECREPMEQGEATAPRGVWWHPGARKHLLAKGELFPFERNHLNVTGEKHAGYVCHSCRVLVLRP